MAVARVLEALKNHKVIPDVLKPNFQPVIPLEIAYGSHQVSLGNVLHPRQAKDIPRVTYNAEKGAFYTLIMADPDAPSRQSPKFREWQHWCVTNVPESRVDAGETLFHYIGPGPPENTGLHRYVCILCKQPGRINFNNEPHLKFNTQGRGGWKSAAFIERHGLTPQGANFFQAEWDDWVPELYRKLEGNLMH